MRTYWEIEEEIAALEKAIKKLQKEIDNDREILAEYDEESEWAMEELRKEQADFEESDVEFQTIELFVRDLADKDVKKTELDSMPAFPMSSKLYEHIPERYALRASGTPRLRGRPTARAVRVDTGPRASANNRKTT